MYQYGGGNLGGIISQIQRLSIPTQSELGGPSTLAGYINAGNAAYSRQSQLQGLKEVLPYIAQASAAEEADKRRFRYQYGL